ncbi:Eukaryotic translation initiation factor 4 gamma 2 [Rhizophlyctis rosea]|uniref:Eukaryotic translation initiation factor 4 gamma 2 n=1 Tax=Rhizophlyctis rosea TaxID=64517 RepID=A0AAD5X1M9_9FUNG|nr:Eukaryotic translation initiation factor 4 gamma 2 [Rhizophlyctis rosea]
MSSMGMASGQLTFGPGGGLGFGGAKGWGSAGKKDAEEKKGGASLSRSGSATGATGGSVNAFALLAAEGGDVRKKSVDEGRKPLALEKKEAPAPVPAEAPKKLTRRQADNKIDGMIAEWINLHDVKEVIATIEELGSDEWHQDAVNAFLSKSFGQKQDEVEKTAVLLARLASENIIAAKVFKDVLKDQYEFSEDESIDNPAIYTYLGIVTARLLTADALTIEDVLELSQPIIKGQGAPKVLGSVLADVKKVDGEEKLVSLWNSWKEKDAVKQFWIPEKRGDEDLANWLDVKGLFVLEPQLELVKPLKWRLGKDDAGAILAWLDESGTESVRSSPAFVRMLSSATIRHVAALTVFPNGPSKPAVELTADVYNKQKDLLTSLKPVLAKYATDTDKKVEVLFGAQAYSAEVGFPKELLQSLFRLFYELEIVDEAAYNAWRDDNRRETSSKKEAVKALQGWFKYLAEQQ